MRRRRRGAQVATAEVLAIVVVLEALVLVIMISMIRLTNPAVHP